MLAGSKPVTRTWGRRRWGSARQIACDTPGSSRLHSLRSWHALGGLIAVALHGGFSRWQHQPAAANEAERSCPGTVPHGLALSWVALGQSCCFFAFVRQSCVQPCSHPSGNAEDQGYLWRQQEDRVWNVVLFLWWLHLAGPGCWQPLTGCFTLAGGGGTEARLALCCTCSEAGSQPMLGIQWSALLSKPAECWALPLPSSVWGCPWEIASANIVTPSLLIKQVKWILAGQGPHLPLGSETS